MRREIEWDSSETSLNYLPNSLINLRIVSFGDRAERVGLDPKEDDLPQEGN